MPSISDISVEGYSITGAVTEITLKSVGIFPLRSSLIDWPESTKCIKD